MADNPKTEIGFLLRPVSVHYGTPTLSVDVISRFNNGEIRNLSWSDYTESSSTLADLCLHGHFSKTCDNQLVGFGVRFTPYCLDNAAQAEAIARTLKKIANRVNKDSAREPGDYLMSVGKAIGATFGVRSLNSASSYREMDFSTYTMPQARDWLRETIAKEIAKMAVAA